MNKNKNNNVISAAKQLKDERIRAMVNVWMLTRLWYRYQILTNKKPAISDKKIDIIKNMKNNKVTA